MIMINTGVKSKQSQKKAGSEIGEGNVHGSGGILRVLERNEYANAKLYA